MLLTLKFRIIEKYGSQTRFARACGKADGWISRLVIARQVATKEEKKLIANKLGVDDIEALFKDHAA